MLKAESWQKKLSELEESHRITDMILLVKSIAVLISVVILFFLSNVIPNHELGLGNMTCFYPETSDAYVTVTCSFQDGSPYLDL